MTKSVGIRYMDVSKSYTSGGDTVSVLRGVNFEVAPGEYIALMGPSGSGKSTLLNLTAGIDRPSGGKVLVGTQEPALMTENELCDWRAHNIGFIFQRYHLLDVMCAEENVEIPLMVFGMGKAERQKRARSALELVGLADRASHYPRQLSGGQEQRVAIARSIVSDPALIIADEPTGDLDTNSAAGILDLLDTLNGMGKTLLVVTHDPNVAKRAHRTFYLQKGQFSEVQAA